jgi:DNA-binding NarL/FixJ family response regulator
MGVIFSKLNCILQDDLQFLNISDISYICLNSVQWSMSTNSEDIKKKFEKHIKKSHKKYFSNRQFEILKHLANGFSSKMIAEKLYLSKHTVDTHRRHMLEKTSCSNTIELVEFARKNYILE